MEENKIEICRNLLDQALVLLREEKATKAEVDGSRELSLAITNIEQGCMWMIRSLFAEKPYSPLTKLKEIDK